MRKEWQKKWKQRALLAGAAALLVAVAASGARAQPCGDVNADGAVNGLDGSLLEATLVGSAPPPPVCGGAGIACADLNANSVVDVGDSVILAKQLAGDDLLFAPCTAAPPPIPCGTTVSGNITSDTTFPGGCETFLQGAVLVVPPAVLTVQPGAVVKGIKNSLNPAALIVTRGAKLNAPGTAANPIVFTSDQPPGSRAIGDWGGVTLNGSAPVNFDGGQGSSEGLPPGLALYGGGDANDNSGFIRFVRVEYSGIEFSPDNELNVFTMNGVGSGTVIDHVQAHMGFDDGHEWFGGTVKAKYLVSTAIRDDDFDWQIGWRGSLQFGLAHKSNAIVAGGGRHGFEADNNELGFDNLPRSNPRVCNVTAIGVRAQPGGVPGGVSGAGANLRRGTAGIVANTILMDWPSACLDLDDAETLSRACTSPTTLRTGADTLLVQDSICFDNGANGESQVTGSAAGAACLPAQAYGLWAASHGLVPANPAEPLASQPNPKVNVSGTFPTVADGRYLPEEPLPAADCEALDPAFFDSAPYVGAFESDDTGGTNWLLDAPACATGQVGGCWINFDLG